MGCLWIGVTNFERLCSGNVIVGADLKYYLIWTSDIRKVLFFTYMESKNNGSRNYGRST